MTLDRRRRAIAELALVSAMLLAGLVAAPVGAAHATQAAPLTEVDGECLPERHTLRWSVPDLGPYRLDEVSLEPAGSTLTGLGALPAEQAGELVFEQTLPPGAASGALTLQITVDGRAQQLTGAQQCADPAAGLLGGFRFDCRWLTVTLTNPHDDPVRLTVVPRGGEPVDVEVAGGRSADVQVPAGEGQSVAVRRDGRSIVDPADPITITATEWAALDCDAAAGEAAGTDLPATGSRVALVLTGALALTGLGGGLYLLARRRRIRFTA